MLQRPEPARWTARSRSRPAAVVLTAAGVLTLLAGGLLGDAPGEPPARTAVTTPAPAVGAGSGDGAAPPGSRPDPAAAPAAPDAARTDVPVRDASLTAAAVPAAVPPTGLAIPSLGITLPVDPVGVAADGQMEIPPLAERAGWYRFGAAPSDPDGSTVIAAHVDSVASAGSGPFARLGQTAVGDAVEVTLADGSVRRYAVTDVRRVAKPDVTWADVFVRDGAPRLILVTCGGTFQRDVGQYSDNVIVTAEPVGG